MSQGPTPGFPALPPAFSGVLVAPGLDPMTAASEAATAGVDAGTVFWSPREDRLEAAIAFAPERPLAEALLMAPLAQTALGDAFGALAPAETAFQWSWPDGFSLNGAAVGRLRACWANDPAHDDPTHDDPTRGDPTRGDRDPGSASVAKPDPTAAPGWLTIALSLQIAPLLADDPGRRPDATALAEEGCGDVTAADLLGAWARHLMFWIYRWEEDGARPIIEAWSARALGRGETVALHFGARAETGLFLGLDDTGALLLKSDGVATALPLADALADPAPWPPAATPRFAVSPNHDGGARPSSM